MDLITLCNKIYLQKEIQQGVVSYYQSDDFAAVYPVTSGLKNMETEAGAREELEQLLGEDPQKIKMLTCMLVCAAELYAWYREKGIPETVFVDTMCCFTRFIEECRQITGRYAFDREWWTARQVSGSLFRIGELEYEMVNRKSDPVISIHIPSDSVLNGEKCDISLENAKKFFAAYFPEYQDRDYICHSWLLAPELCSLLSQDSKIIAFQQRFKIQEVDYSDTDYIEWVFKTRDVLITDLPEDTGLQRNMKRHLLNGGRIGTGYGILTDHEASI